MTQNNENPTIAPPHCANQLGKVLSKSIHRKPTNPKLHHQAISMVWEIQLFEKMPLACYKGESTCYAVSSMLISFLFQTYHSINRATFIPAQEMGWYAMDMILSVNSSDLEITNFLKNDR